MIFNHAVYANKVCYSLPVLSVLGNTALPFVPMTKTVIAGEVTGPLFAGDVTHLFHYSTEQCDQVIEAIYRFPLPGDAVVTGVTVRFGDREIEAVLKERQEAETDYREAKKQGRQAAMATRESPDVFTLRITGIQPDQDVLIQTFFVQLAEPEGEGWTLRVPLTVAPRFVRSDERGRHAQGNPLATALDPGHTFRFHITGYGWDDIECPSHDVTVYWEDNEATVTLKKQEEIANRDLILRYKPLTLKDGYLNFYTYDDNDWRYFLALIKAPQDRADPSPSAREVVLLIDHSGSMRGKKWEAADNTAKQIINSLNETDFFNIGIFHNDCYWLSRRNPIAASGENKKRAMQFVENSKDSGGTELGVALEQALAQRKMTEEAVRHIAIITDGEVSDFGRLLSLADEEGSQPDGRHIHVVCIDSSPNALLARQMASRTGGIALFLTSAESLDDRLSSVAHELLQSVAGNGLLRINRSEGQAANRPYITLSDQAIFSLGGVPLGRPLWLSGRVPVSDNGIAYLEINNEEVATAEIYSPNGNPAIKHLFGASRLLELEFLHESLSDQEEIAIRLRRLGYHESAETLLGKSRKKYTENRMADAEKAVYDLLVSESLYYGVACSATAFIAVSSVSGQLVEKTVIVANAAPEGWLYDDAGYDVDGDSYEDNSECLVFERNDRRYARNTMPLYSYVSVGPSIKTTREENSGLAANVSVSLSPFGRKLLYADQPSFTVFGESHLKPYIIDTPKKLLSIVVTVDDFEFWPGDELRLFINNDATPIVVLKLAQMQSMTTDILLEKGDRLQLVLITSQKVRWPSITITAEFAEP